MTLDDIEKMLPNGFHDALLEEISINYLKREAVFNLLIWIGDITSSNRDLRETYRRGQMRLSDLIFCVIEPPDSKYPYCEAKHLCIDGGSLGSLRSAPLMQLPKSLTNGTFTYWFFVQQWNAFIYVAAKDAKFDWNEQNTASQHV